MKTAVLFHGLVQRSLPHVVGSIRSCLLDPLAARGEVRVFHHTWQVPHLDNPRAGESGPAADAGDGEVVLERAAERERAAESGDEGEQHDGGGGARAPAGYESDA